MDLTAYRARKQEQERISDLFELIPLQGHTAIDIGARDGYLACRLADRFTEVIALDLEKPNVTHSQVIPVKGDVCSLNYSDRHFDVVLCAEVLEHIPTEKLEAACHELERVSRRVVVIGVPYRQDLRCGRTTCNACGRHNPPWGHVNYFDEERLKELFQNCDLERVSVVGSTKAVTNAISTSLLDYAGNPFGTWDQDEPCIFCGCHVGTPKQRSISRRIATRAAILLNLVQRSFTPAHGNWIHARFRIRKGK